jgi:uncharacterized surface protein with fasciclin (FAS1) repeats
VRNLPFRLLALLFAGALVLAACGDDDDDAADDAGTEDAAAETDDEAAGEDPGTIVDVAVAAGDFTTLVSAVEAADLVETLSGEGPFTVFAPTDAAFEALPEGALDDLLADTEALAGVLTYHVVPEELLAADVVEVSEVATVNGAALPVMVDGETVMVGDATVVTTDIDASNGVIHVIDAVLLPPEG